MTAESILLPHNHIGRFAIVKLWPELKTAEDECIARLKKAAEELNIECIEIHADGTLLTNPSEKVSKSTVDFVIHLHYDTPKFYDAFSFVALWNPPSFYHEWGYRRCSRNLTTHDDFLTCGSPAADSHVMRMIRTEATHLSPQFNLYHSLHDIIHDASLGEQKLFYVGINWEAINGGKSRHHEILKRLDKTGYLKIFGPKIFQGVEVWAGFDSYVREIPFDGISLMKEIASAGIALVLSSPAHKEAALMSNRLFESVAAGALVICDENPFAKRHFGNSLLYIDTRKPVDEVIKDITCHVEWARENPDQAFDMIKASQEIFRRNFTLTKSLSRIYSDLPARKRALSERQSPIGAPSIQVRVNFLMPMFCLATLQSHLESIDVQEYTDFTPVLAVNASFSAEERDQISAVLKNASGKIDVTEISFFQMNSPLELQSWRPLGAVILDLLEQVTTEHAFIVVAPNEQLFSNHLSVLAGALQRSSDTTCAATAAILKDQTKRVHSVHETLDFNYVNPQSPCGYGRFIFRVSSVPSDIHIALPFLDGRALAVLVGNERIEQQLPASLIIDISQTFPNGNFSEQAETETIRDFNPQALRILTGFGGNQTITAPEATLEPLRILQVILRLFNPYAYFLQIRAMRRYGIRQRASAIKVRLGF